ncbi:extracellular solute-binding protein [Micromonospora humi]|uniref:Multiple sugar transport system substrate-binding protein n=1 Tax=Micromonospora humi TaxID=745366 RepID=A0A1C5IXQ5_9ACTN|nr:extracellular solute-binding protein [Micromonospora humi]SCG63003.1 multiple sugar transport system substrate-binding protein [Micromonospora humi]
MPSTRRARPTPGRERRRWWRAFGLGLLSGVLVAASCSLLLWKVAGPKGLEPGDLVVLTGRDDSEGQQRQALLKLWNAANPHNQARMISLNEAADAQYAEMINRGERENDQDIDVFNLDVTWTAAFAEKNLLRPIDERRLADPPDEAFLEKPLRTCRYQGRLWALPFNTDAGLLYYRRDLGLKPPFDWPKIEAESTRLLDGRASGLKAGFTSQLAGYEGLTVNALEALWAHGGELRVDDRGRVSVDPKRLADALRSLTPSATGASVVSSGALNQNEDQSREAFAVGEVAFMRNWPVAYRKLTGADASAPASPAASRVGVTALPGPSVLGGQNLAVARQSRQPRAAQALIEYLTGEESQRTLFEKGGFAATRAVVYSDAIIKENYPYLPLLRDAVDRARLRPVSPHYVNFSLVLRGYVMTVLKREGTLPDDLARRLTDALRGATPASPAPD